MQLKIVVVLVLGTQEHLEFGPILQNWPFPLHLIFSPVYTVKIEIGQNFPEWCKTLDSKANSKKNGEFWEWYRLFHSTESAIFEWANNLGNFGASSPFSNSDEHASHLVSNFVRFQPFWCSIISITFLSNARCRLLWSLRNIRSWGKVAIQKESLIGASEELIFLKSKPIQNKHLLMIWASCCNSGWSPRCPAGEDVAALMATKTTIRSRSHPSIPFQSGLWRNQEPNIYSFVKVSDLTVKSLDS